MNKIYTCDAKTGILTALKHASKLIEIEKMLKDSVKTKHRVPRPEDLRFEKDKNNKNIMGSHIEVSDKEIEMLSEYLPVIKEYATLALEILGRKTKVNTFEDYLAKEKNE